MKLSERLIWAAAYALEADDESAKRRVLCYRDNLSLLSLQPKADLTAAERMLLEFDDDSAKGPTPCPACGALARVKNKCLGCGQILG